MEARRYDAALEIFRRLADQNPEDFESRNWVARLESWKGSYREAEQLYRDVLAEAPDNREAELGLVDVLGWQERFSEALDRLYVLRALQPTNPEVLLRLARIFRWQRKRNQALEYYRQVHTNDPRDPEAREAVEALSAQKPFQVAAGYFLEEFDFADDTHGQFIEFQYRDYNRLAVLARFQYQNKFAERNTRYTLGATLRSWQRTWLRGEYSWAPAGDRVIPNEDYSLEISQGTGRQLAIGAGYRFLAFQDARVHIWTALLNWDLRPHLHFYLHYTPDQARFDLPAESVWNHGGWARMEWDAGRKLSPYLLFAVGNENFSGVSREQLGQFAAQTYGIGSELRLTPAQGFRVSCYFQNRSQGHWERSLGVSYFFGF